MTLEGSLTVTVGATVTFSLTVTNTSDAPTTITFPDGRQVDVAVFADDGDDPIWRWSEGRMFTQAVEHLELEPGGSRSWTREWIDPSPGHLRAVAELVAECHLTAAATFHVGAGG